MDAPKQPIVGRLVGAALRVDPRLWILLAGTLVGLVVAFLVKARCLEHFNFADLCYNDIQPLYRARSLDQLRVPYVQAFLEYPVLIGLFVYLVALVSPSMNGFFVMNALLLAPFAIATTVLLYQAVPAKRRIALWAAGTPLVLYAFHNWDLIAVLLATLGLLLHTKNKPVPAAVALALGAAAKIYPGFFFPLLALHLYRTEGRLGPQTRGFLVAFPATWLLVNLPVMIANLEGWWATYAFHIDRGATYESPWWAAYYHLLGDGRSVDTEAIKFLNLVIAGPLFALGLGALVIPLWRRRLHPWDAALGVLLLFLILNKVFSVQYTLWLLPFFVLRPISYWKYGALEAADLAVYVGIFTFLEHIRSPSFDAYYVWVAIATFARLAVLLWILGGLLRSAWTKPMPEAVAVPPLRA